MSRGETVRRINSVQVSHCFVTFFWENNFHFDFFRSYGSSTGENRFDASLLVLLLLFSALSVASVLAWMLRGKEEETSRKQYPERAGWYFMCCYTGVYAGKLGYKVSFHKFMYKT